MLAKVPDGRLPVLRGIADVACFRPNDVSEPALEGFDRRSRVVNAQRRLRDVGNRRIVRHIEPFDVVAVFDKVNGAGNPPERSFDLHIPGVADQDDSTAERRIPLCLRCGPW